MGSTVIEKILARTAGREQVTPGEIVVCCPDMVVQIDLCIGIDGFWHRPLRVFDPSRIVLVFDHGVPAPTIKDASAMVEGRRFAKEFNIKALADVGSHGISHVIAAEAGLARPGELYLCADSHTCSVGAFNCAGRGTGVADIMQAITKGVVWYPVSSTVRYEIVGELQPAVSGKDVFFHIAHVFGGHNGLSIEFGGTGLKNLPMHERRTIATMCAELSAEFSIFDFDEITAQFLRERMEHLPTPVKADPDAKYVDVRQLDLSSIEPYVIRPNFVAHNGVRLSELEPGIKIDQAFIGSCANGQIEDLRIAARMLAGRRVAPNVRLIVTPGSQSIHAQAAREGLVATLIEAGAVFTNSTCGACCGHHMGLLAAGEVCITASTRNFKGRMGSSNAQVYLASPATVAASAMAGVIADPRQLKLSE